MEVSETSFVKRSTYVLRALIAKEPLFFISGPSMFNREEISPNPPLTSRLRLFPSFIFMSNRRQPATVIGRHASLVQGNIFNRIGIEHGEKANQVRGIVHG